MRQQGSAAVGRMVDQSAFSGNLQACTLRCRLRPNIIAVKAGGCGCCVCCQGLHRMHGPFDLASPLACDTLLVLLAPNSQAQRILQPAYKPPTRCACTHSWRPITGVPGQALATSQAQLPVGPARPKNAQQWATHPICTWLAATGKPQGLPRHATYHNPAFAAAGPLSPRARHLWSTTGAA
jgi:hypothetical protein